MRGISIGEGGLRAHTPEGHREITGPHMLRKRGKVLHTTVLHRGRVQARLTRKK